MAQPKLPEEIKAMSLSFISGLRHILGSRLYGVYQYGSAVFPDDGAIQDLDCHVIIKRQLSEGNRKAIQALQADLSTWNPNLCENIDAYFVLLSEAKKTGNPINQLNPSVVDTSWALHCAHIRAGYYRVLWGPQPNKIFPPPSWPAVKTALESELTHIQSHHKHPDHCILNLCRIIYSYTTRDPVVSKKGSGLWASQQFPPWNLVIQAAIRCYCRDQGPVDEIMINARMPAFQEFALEHLRTLRPDPIH